jgi:hypothetical protein
MFVDGLQGFAGVAYRRGFFDQTIFEAYQRDPACFFADDVWISGYLAERGLVRRQLPCIWPTPTPNSNVNALKNEPDKVTANRRCAACWNFLGGERPRYRLGSAVSGGRSSHRLRGLSNLVRRAW